MKKCPWELSKRQRTWMVLYMVVMISLMGLDIRVSDAGGAWVMLIWLAVGFLFVGAAWLWKRFTDRRAERHWEGLDAEIVRTEKVESLGHTLGGLSEARDVKAGMLSESSER